MIRIRRITYADFLCILFLYFCQASRLSEILRSRSSCLCAQLDENLRFLLMYFTGCNNSTSCPQSLKNVFSLDTDQQINQQSIIIVNNASWYRSINRSIDRSIVNTYYVNYRMVQINRRINRQINSQ